jgi:hypothetical protein
LQGSIDKKAYLTVTSPFLLVDTKHKSGCDPDLPSLRAVEDYSPEFVRHEALNSYYLKKEDQGIFGEFHRVLSYLAHRGGKLSKVEPYKGIFLNGVTRAPRLIADIRISIEFRLLGSFSLNQTLLQSDNFLLDSYFP